MVSLLGALPVPASIRLQLLTPFLQFGRPILSPFRREFPRSTDAQHRIGAKAEWCSMSLRQHTVLTETSKGRAPAKFTVPAGATQIDVAIKARDNGLRPYRVRFDPIEGVWLLTLLD
jgi:hypothetical protein